MLLAATTLLPAARGQEHGAGEADFLNLCARCHGETGDGQGTEQLDRPARSFQDGGFSFGNTQTAIERTISFGIPGSPMPAFGETLAQERVAALAAWVLTMTPPVTEVSAAATILAADAHPVVARGGLPPITDGALAHPRGLLLGLPQGLTFEYRVEDLALLGVRAGEFARRADWTGRGGAPLEPLGKVVWLANGGAPAALLQHELAESREPLRAVLRATRTPAERPSLEWDALGQDGQILAHVREYPRAVTTSLGGGFARELVVVSPGDRQLVLSQPLPAGEPLTRVGSLGLVVRRDDGLYEAALLRVDAAEDGTPQLDNGYLVRGSPEGLEVELGQGQLSATITLTTLLMAAWPEDGEARLLEELKR